MLITACGKDIRKALLTIVLSVTLLRTVMAPGVRGARRRRRRRATWSRWLVWLVELIEILKKT